MLSVASVWLCVFVLVCAITRVFFVYLNVYKTGFGGFQGHSVNVFKLSEPFRPPPRCAEFSAVRACYCGKKIKLFNISLSFKEWISYSYEQL